MDVVYLSRRNLLTLLSKLDRLEAGEPTACMIIKKADPEAALPATGVAEPEDLEILIIPLH